MIIGDYNLLEIIGNGMYGTVYKARKTDDNSLVAAKIILKTKLANGKLQEYLENEITIMKNLKHPNIVKLFNSYETTSKFILILEYCDSGDLGQYIHQQNLDPRIVIKQLLSAVVCLHQHNIIHRDIKPANVLLDGTLQGLVVKLTDFGYSKYLSQNRLTETVCGTPLYMAPEVLTKNEYGWYVDIWSVGCILCEMILGKHPFKATSEKELYRKIVQGGELNMLYSLKLENEVVVLILKMLDIYHLKRPSAVEAMKCSYFEQEDTSYIPRVLSFTELDKEDIIKGIQSCESVLYEDKDGFVDINKNYFSAFF